MMRAYLRSLLQTRTVRTALACACALVALPAFELGYRLQTHRPVLVLEDWRAGRIEDLRFGNRVGFDPELGWVLREYYESDRYNTLEQGIRRNFGEKDIRIGGLLAVGDAFADGGTEVADSDTWPAQLERIIGVPVLNGGVAGYAADQIVLRAERLLAAVQPGTLIVGVNEQSIERVGFSSYGSPKPYHTIDNGSLAYHAPTREPASGTVTADWRAKVRDILGYSAVLDVVLGHIAPVYWAGSIDPPVFRTVDNDPAAVTCALLQRLKARTGAADVRVLLLMQHARKTIADSVEPGGEVRTVLSCAAAAGLEVVDQLASLRAAVAADPAALDELYLTGGFEQMTRAGNGRTAALLASDLGRTAALEK